MSLFRVLLSNGESFILKDRNWQRALQQANEAVSALYGKGVSVRRILLVKRG